MTDSISLRKGFSRRYTLNVCLFQSSKSAVRECYCAEDLDVIPSAGNTPSISIEFYPTLRSLRLAVDKNCLSTVAVTRSIASVVQFQRGDHTFGRPMIPLLSVLSSGEQQGVSVLWIDVKGMKQLFHAHMTAFVSLLNQNRPLTG